jgi:uncharacterized OsmC-like protein
MLWLLSYSEKNFQMRFIPVPTEHSFISLHCCVCATATAAAKKQNRSFFRFEIKRPSVAS